MLGDRMIAMKVAVLIALACAMGAAQPRESKFEVASVKPFKDDGVSPRNSHATYGPDGINFGAFVLAAIIGEAYQFPVGRIQGSGSLTKESLWAPLRVGYDIVAKADHPVSKDQLRLMLQSLLADRFKLALHRESKTGPVYKLVVAKNGAQIGKSLEESQDLEGQYSVSRSPAGFVFRNADMTGLSVFLSNLVDRPVIDRSGLTGRYNFTIKVDEIPTDKNGVSAGVTPDTPSSAAFAESLKRLGLQLIAGRDAVDYLVIDHVQPLSDN
jgi:uncharacterized protein (TIGR03435 family)